MDYINKHVKHYRRVYIKQTIKDIWGKEYTPMILAIGLVLAVYGLLLTKLIDYMVGGI